MTKYLILLLTVLSRGLFAQNTLGCQEYGMDYSRWENIMYKHLLPSEQDIVYYANNNPCYDKQLNGDSSAFYHYYPNGALHVKGTNIRIKKRRVKKLEGNWTIYHTNGRLKEKISFRNKAPYGVYLKLSEEGDTLRSRYYRQKIAYGFHLGYTRNLYRLTPSANADSKLTTENSYGFMLGVGIYYESSPRVLLRSMPSIAFQAHHLSFVDITQRKEEVTIEETILDVPVHALIKIFPEYPAFLVAGTTFTTFPGIRNEEEPVLTRRTVDVSLDIGLSYLIDLKFARMMPEVRFSKALTNVKKMGNAPYDQFVNNITRDQITIVIQFL